MSLQQRRRDSRDSHIGRRLGDDRGRDWRDVATNQGMPRMAGHHQELEEAGWILLEASEGCAAPLADPLISDLCSQELRENRFLLFKRPSSGTLLCSPWTSYRDRGGGQAEWHGWHARLR